VNEPALANAGPSDARALRQSMRQDDWLGAIDRRLCVVALDEAVLGQEHAVVGIAEVPPRLGSGSFEGGRGTGPSITVAYFV
jgi:hypothetical protein